MPKKILKPLVHNGDYLPSEDMTPLVYPGNFTTLKNKEKNSIAEDSRNRQDSEGADP